jgi:hypothetical protein
MAEWQSPKLCGCVLFRSTKWEWTKPGFYEDAQGTVSYGRRQIATELNERIVSQCAEHAHLKTPDELWEELRHLHGNVHHPDTCACARYYWWDDREEQDARVEHHLHHDDHTKKCRHHKHHDDAEAHAQAMLAENQHKNRALGAIEEAFAPETPQEKTGKVTLPAPGHQNLRQAEQSSTSEIPAHAIRWSIHEDTRHLTLTLPEGADHEKARAALAAHPQVDESKVTVE